MACKYLFEVRVWCQGCPPPKEGKTEPYLLELIIKQNTSQTTNIYNRKQISVLPKKSPAICEAVDEGSQHRSSVEGGVLVRGMSAVGLEG